MRSGRASCTYFIIIGQAVIDGGKATHKVVSKSKSRSTLGANCVTVDSTVLNVNKTDHGIG